jgi:hypothetical protein
MGRAIVVLLLLSARAEAADYVFSGSGSLDYRGVLSGAGGPQANPTLGIDSMVFELSHKTVVDVTERLSVSVKICVGCHGFEVDQGYAELHLHDAVNLRFGRINVPIGEFNVRHDPANYTTPSKPLPYAMGDMLHYTRDGFNLGVVPTPYSDDGIEIFGGVAAGQVLIDYTVYAVKGFAGQNDFDFQATRRFTDNNSTPAGGARVVASVGPFSIGGSAAAGTYDAKDNLWYYIFGGEAYARVNKFVLRGEYIMRRTDIDTTAPGYQFEIKEPYFVKKGWYAQLDWEPSEYLTLIYRFDGLRREGIPLPGSELEQVFTEALRHTIAFAARPWGGVLFKAGYEFWTFSGTPYPDAHMVRVGMVYSY